MGVMAGMPPVTLVLLPVALPLGLFPIILLLGLFPSARLLRLFPPGLLVGLFPSALLLGLVPGVLGGLFRLSPGLMLILTRVLVPHVLRVLPICLCI